MDLAVPREHTVTNQTGRLGECILGGLVPPGVGSEMVAAKQYLFSRKSQSLCPPTQSFRKITRRLPGISTFLIDLAGCGFDMHDGVVFDSLLQGRVQDPWIGRAHGIGPNCFGPAISPHHVLEIIPGVSIGRPGWVLMSAHTLIAIILRIITIYFELEQTMTLLC